MSLSTRVSLVSITPKHTIRANLHKAIVLLCTRLNLLPALFCQISTHAIARSARTVLSPFP
jgi:hypothetical protein